MKKPFWLGFQTAEKKKPEVAATDDWYAGIIYVLYKNMILLMEKGVFLECVSVWSFYIPKK